MSARKRALTPFGAIILDMLDAAKAPHYKFFEAVGISKAYFYDTLTGQPPAPDVIERMLVTLDAILPPDPNRRTAILDQAAKTKSEIPPDIYDAIRQNPDGWDKLRKFLKKQF